MSERLIIVLTAPMLLVIYIICGAWGGMVKFAYDLKRDWKATKEK